MALNLTAVVYILIITRHMVGSTHPECSIVLHLLQKENECKLKIKTAAAASVHSSGNETAGCTMEWDGVSCWPSASEGQIISVPCPLPQLEAETPSAVISRNCTARGWSKPSAAYWTACYSEAHYGQDEDMGKERNYFDTLRLMYSVGYGASLAALLIALLVFCCFRRLLCTRNYIHLHLFVSFMLRSLAVFIKDAVLFADDSTDHCTVSTLRCKAAVTFFHFCVLSNFSWLLVEGLYLQTLLLFTFTRTRKLLWIYTFMGWALPSVTIVAWALLKAQLDDEGCWDNLESRLWWIIKVPVLLSIFINLVIFLNINRIIVQKTKVTHRNQSETQIYRTLVRSTLLLIPLFGIHYAVFALIPEHVGVKPRLFLELVLGSFQGFIVAVLYCFLNGEVQREMQRAMRRFRSNTKTNEAINLRTLEDIP